MITGKIQIMLIQSQIENRARQSRLKERTKPKLLAP
jgi:hypothetical protein